MKNKQLTESQLDTVIDKAIEKSDAVVIKVEKDKPTKRTGLYATVISIVLILIPLIADYLQKVTGYDFTQVFQALTDILTK